MKISNKRHTTLCMLVTRPMKDELQQVKLKEHRADALALRADERRDKLRKAAVRSKYPVTRRCLNGETWRSKPPSPYT